MRKILFRLHLIAGLAAALVILSMSVTGTLLAFEPQITEWSERGVRNVPEPEAGARRIDVDRLLDNAKREFPRADPVAVMLWSRPGASVAVNLVKEIGTVFLDPYSGRMLGRESGIHAAFRKLLEWHRWFGSREIGKPITGAASLVLIFMILSGLLLWRPRRWTTKTVKAIAVPRIGLKGKARDWNWHHAAGIWSALPLLLIAGTGAIMSYQWANNLLFRAVGDKAPTSTPVMTAHRGERPEVRLDPLIAKADSALPTWSAITIRLPRKPGDRVVAFIQEPGFSRRFARAQLSVDPASPDTFIWEPYRDQKTGRKLRAWVLPVHMGTALGIPGQILAGLASAAAALLVLTGLALTRRRLRNGPRRNYPVAPKEASADLKVFPGCCGADSHGVCYAPSGNGSTPVPSDPRIRSPRIPDR